MYNYSTLPEHMQESIKNYMEKGIPPGDFLQAVLENNLVQAVVEADDINRHLLYQWAIFLCWEAPSISWGSEENVNTWIAHQGLEGLKNAKR